MHICGQIYICTYIWCPPPHVPTFFYAFLSIDTLVLPMFCKDAPEKTLVDPMFCEGTLAKTLVLPMFFSPKSRKHWQGQ